MMLRWLDRKPPIASQHIATPGGFVYSRRRDSLFMGKRRESWWLRLAVAGVMVISTAAFVACGGDDDDGDADTTPGATSEATSAATAAATTEPVTGDAADIEAAMQAVFDNWNAKDVDAFVAGFTDEGIVAVFGEEGQTAADVVATLPEFIGSEQIENVTFANSEASGTTGSTEVQFSSGGGFEKSKYSFVKEGDAWLVNAEERLAVELPDGVTPVHVDANEFAFGVDTNEITTTTTAFEFTNVGEQPHELVLVSIPVDAVIDDLLAQFAASEDGEVPGTEFAGFVDAEPGDTNNLVLAEPLASGRYVMLCFFPDLDEGEEGTPHALKGMVKDFTIQ